MTLEQIKDNLANEHYSVPYWIWLNDYQRSCLVDLVAIQYALAQLNEHLKEIDEPCAK